MPEGLNVHSSWVDLIDIAADARILLVDGAGSRAEAALRKRSADVTVIRLSEVATIPVSGEWDLVCLDKVDAAALPTPFWTAVRASRSAVVVVGDTRTSPLWLLDRIGRGGSGSGRTASTSSGRGRAERRLADAGLTTHQVFGLLRSGDAPVVAFDARARSSLAAVLGATRAHVGGWRASVLSAAARLPAARVLALCPSWLIVAGAPGPAAADRVVGKVSNRDSEEIKLLRGEPVSVVERRHLVAHTTGEVAALREMEAVGFARAPRIVGEPTPEVSRYSWLPGAALALDRLDEEALTLWVGRAAEVLAEIQELTRRPDGTVLIHGDFWLGNLLTSGDQITAVVDWTEADRGSEDVDRTFLVASLERWITSDALRARLERVRDSAFGG